MRKILYLFLIILAFPLLAFAQETSISITYDNYSIEEIIGMIEEKTELKFFYVEDWVDDQILSGSYTDVPLEDLLAVLFKDTTLNYYITEDNNVILTQNNLIYDRLPQGFFKEVNSDTGDEIPKEEINAPVFYNEVAGAISNPIETIRIGKEDRNRSRNRFTLRGSVSNATNGGPISNAAIVVLNQNIGTVTDKSGNFEIELSAGVNMLELNSLGFQKTKKRLVIYNDGSVNLGMNEAIEGLAEVIVEANVDRNVKETSTGTTKIEVEEIKNIPLVLGERDIFKAAATLPGIASAGEGAAGYNVRGGRTDQNLVLLDDAVIYNPAHFFGIFSAINPFTSDEVTIYKGNVPAEYGGRLSSVFDIKTRDANVEKFSGEASIGPVTGNLVLEIPLVKDRSAIMLGGRATYSDWILRNLDEEELQKSKASFYDINVKYNSRLNENNELKATVYYSNDRFSITTDSLYGYRNRLASVRWNHRFNEKNSGGIILTNSRYGFDIEFDGQVDTDFELGYAINETELKANLVYKMNDVHKFNYGLATKLYRVEPGNIEPGGDNSIVSQFGLPDERGLESALYVSDTYVVNEKLTLEAGVRYSFFAALGSGSQNVYQDGIPKSDASLLEVREFGKGDVIETYGAPELRIGGRYLFDPTFSVKASFNTQNQYIHTLSSNTTVSPIDTWKLSDLNIKPQKGIQYALGFFKNMNNNTYEFSIEGYYKTIDDLLDYKVGAQLLLNETLEQEVLQGEGRAYGVEFLIRKIKGRFNGWLGYTYSRSEVKLDSQFAEEQVNGGEYFPSNYDKPHDLSFVGNFKITKRFSFSGNFVYQTGRPVTVPVGNFIVNNTELVLFSNRNEFRIPDFYRLDLSFNVEGNHKRNKLAHSFWNISVYNVLGRNNPYSVFFVTENGEIKAFQSSIFSIPIPTITYNLKF